jgi:hypothetical protein
MAVHSPRKPRPWPTSPSMFEVVIGEEELLRELQELADYWPWDLSDLRVGWPYPQVARLLTPYTFVVPGNAQVH